MSLPLNFRPLFNTLLHYTEHKNLRKGRALHARILECGSSSCNYISNSLVNFYAKCGQLADALLVFKSIQGKDVVSWNCIINGFSQQGGSRASSSVMELFCAMRAENVFPNGHTFAGVFTAAAGLGYPLVGQQAHGVAIKIGNCSDVFVGSSLLNMYCKMGLLYEARKVFDEMPERNPVSWAAMISGYSSQRLARETLELFNLMLMDEQQGVNEFVLTSVLSAFTLPNFVENGKQIHCLSIKNGLLCITSVGNSIVTMYAKCGYLDNALQTFQLLNFKNSITWSAMITGYAQSGSFEKALELFIRMHRSGNAPSEFTLVGVLNACSDMGSAKEGKQMHCYALKLGFESQIYIMTALVDMYAKCSCLDDARKGFDHLHERDMVLWTSMIGGYIQNGENEEGLALYCRMQTEGVIPNELTMTSVLKACSSLAALEQGKQVHGRIIKYGFDLRVPMGSALSTMYAKCGNLEDGNLVFTRMPSRDVVSWNAMISGLSQNGLGLSALNLFDEMRLDNEVKPDHVTFVNVLSACSHTGLVERGMRYFDMMFDEFGIEPEIEHYACMVDILSRSGRLEEAKEFIESSESRIENAMCLWRILLGASRNYRDFEMGTYAGEKLMEMGSRESSAYVLLSSVYSELGKKDEVERVRRMMSVRMVSKEPGCSWIELKGRVHVFVVGDLMHPEIDETRWILLNVSQIMVSNDDDKDESLFCDAEFC